MPMQRHPYPALPSTHSTGPSMKTAVNRLKLPPLRPNRPATDANHPTPRLSARCRPREPPTKPNRVQRRCTLDRAHPCCYKPRCPSGTLSSLSFAPSPLPTHLQKLTDTQLGGNNRRSARSARVDRRRPGWRLNINLAILLLLLPSSVLFSYAAGSHLSLFA
jgi:hypothetical protein